MNSVELSGLRGDNPLEFLAALGVLRVAAEAKDHPSDHARLLWEPTAFHALLDTRLTMEQVADTVARDAHLAERHPILAFAYPKVEKNGAKRFAGLAPPSAALRAFLNRLLRAENHSSLRLAAGLMTDAVTEPIPVDAQPSDEDFAAIDCEIDETGRRDHRASQSAFDFTSRNAQFLDQARLIAASLSGDIVFGALTGSPQGASATQRTLGWDTAADVPAALYSYARPVNPALEWLAFRALSFFPVVPARSAARTTACEGRRKNGTFSWPLWSVPIGVRPIEALLSRPQLWRDDRNARPIVGVVHVFKTRLTKGADGYSGVFSPSWAV